MNRLPSDANSKIAFADSLRGVACLSVLVSHYCGVFWLHRSIAAGLINSPELAGEFQTPILVIWLDALPQFNWGNFGVALFFLISGFVIPFSFNSYDRVGFLVARAFRIVPTYIASFGITILALGCISAYYARPFPYETSHVFAHFIPGLRDLLWLPQIDGVVWTLEIELKFYLLCAVLAPLLRTPSMWLLIVPAAFTAGCFFLMILGAPSWHGTDLVKRAGLIFLLDAPYLIFMFIGVTLNLFYRRAISRTWTTIAVTALFLTFLMICQATKSIPSYGVALGVFVACLIARDSLGQNILLRFFADVSYPLYVVHPVLGYALLRVLMDLGMWSSAAIIVTTATAVLASFVIHRVVELPTRKIGRDWGRAISCWLSGGLDVTVVPGIRQLLSTVRRL